MAPKSSSVNDQLAEPTAMTVPGLVKMRFDAPQHLLPAATKNGSAFPTDVVPQHPRRVEARLAAQVPERREPAERLRVEQIAPEALHLHAPDERPHRRATEKPQCRQIRRTAHHRISRRADSACAIVTPSAYSRSPPTGNPRAMRDTTTRDADAS